MMERNANFIVVGVITLVGLIGLGLFAFWLGKYGSDEEQFRHYRTYLYESVSGLKASSPVRLKGIDVGVVEEIGIDGENPERIRIDFKIENNIPIKTDSVIVLSSQGIAGIAFLEIKGGTNDSPFIRDIDKSERPVLTSQPSVVSVLSDKAETIFEHIDNTTAKLDRLVSERNIQNTQTSLENLALISTELKQNRHEITALLKGARDLEANTTQTLKDFSVVAQKSGAVLEETKTMVNEGKGLIREFKDSDHATKLSAVLENTNEAVEEGKSLLREGKILIKSLQESPSDLLFKSKPKSVVSDDE